jgi:N4-gp56 family major capsid protein
MAGHNYDTQQSRLLALSGEFIAAAQITEVLGGIGKQVQMPSNKTDTVILASWVPYGGTVANPNTWSYDIQTHITTEGVTPQADSIQRRDIPIKLVQYMALYSFTDKDEMLYEDDIKEGMKMNVSQRMSLVRELAIWGQLKACTNKFYSGGSTRAAVSGKITESILNKITRSLNASHAKMITKVLDSTTSWGTRQVEPAFVCYAHSDLEQDFRDLPGFIVTSLYGQRKLVNNMELGSWRNIRVVLSPELQPYKNAATSVTASTYGLSSTGGTNPDVYPVVICGEDSFAQVALRGKNAIESIYIPTTSTKDDPGGQRGYIGAKFWHGAAVTNSGWMAVAEVAVSDLS